MKHYGHMCDECSSMEWGHHDHGGYPDKCTCGHEYDCHPKLYCKPVKECVKTYKTYYKLYRYCYYRLYKICSRCGHEFDHYEHRGCCPKCR
ncbi:MAG TPA: hypothetical protein PKA10_08580 [Selenomonadales bacterium]|nr:hypothetical protein [Selenomonadales bacterium]